MSAALDDLIVLESTCLYCQARPGQWCKTARGGRVGARAAYLHSSRGWATRQARWVGYCEGQSDMIRSVIAILGRAGDAASELSADATVADVLAALRGQGERAHRWQEEARSRVLSEFAEVTA